MAKIFGLNGVVVGRQGNNVFSVRAGEQVLRKYQPNVFNPNTEAQMATRAKMKLMSQLSAVMSSAIAMPRMGMKSSRNQFVSVNFPAATYLNGNADIDLTAVKLTKGVIPLSSMIASRTAVNTIEAHIGGINTGHPFADVDRVEYFAFVENTDGTLRLAQKASSSTLEGGFSVTMSMGTSRKAIVYAYGVRFNSEAARVAYGDIAVVEANDIARLISNRVLLESDVTMSDTQAVVVDPQSTQNNVSDPRGNENGGEGEGGVVKKKK